MTSQRVVLVAGGSRGIGRAVCLEFARSGAAVAFLYRTNEAAAAATAVDIEAAGGVAMAMMCDVADRAAVQASFDRVIARFGRLDVLVHSAGMPVDWVPVRAHDGDAWRRFVEVDLIGGFNTIQAALGAMQPAGSGVILAISSIAAQMCQARNSQGAAAKAGLEALIRVVAKEEGRNGIRANAVAVGLTDTDMTREAAEAFGKETMERLIKGFPIQRIGDPAEIARVVHFLCSEDAAYITGKVLQVDGGQFIAG